MEIKPLECGKGCNCALLQCPGNGMSSRNAPSLLLEDQDSPGLWPLPTQLKGWAGRSLILPR